MLSAQTPKLTQEQKLAIFAQCCNINSIDKEDPDRVYCWHFQEWRHCAGTTCTHERRFTRSSQEW